MGEITVRNGGERRYLTCFWGFAEVLPGRVNILAEIGERAEDIDRSAGRAAQASGGERLKAVKDEAGYEETRVWPMSGPSPVSPSPEAAAPLSAVSARLAAWAEMVRRARTIDDPADPHVSSATVSSSRASCPANSRPATAAACSGFFWSFINPLLLLLTYGLVFGYIMPRGADEDRGAVLPLLLLRNSALDLVPGLDRRGLRAS